MSLCSSLWVLSLSGCLEHLLIVSGQGIMVRAEWMLSKSWPPRKASASPTQTKSTATLGRRALTDFCASSESGFPRPEWWCASAKGWLSGASWAPCGALASWASSHSSEGKFLSLSPSLSLSLSNTPHTTCSHWTGLPDSKTVRCALVLNLTESEAIAVFMIKKSRAEQWMTRWWESFRKKREIVAGMFCRGKLFFSFASGLLPLLLPKPHVLYS